MPTCPSERCRLFHRAWRRALPRSESTGSSAGDSRARPPTSASTKLRLVSGSMPKGTVAKTGRAPADPSKVP